MTAILSVRSGLVILSRCSLPWFWFPSLNLLESVLAGSSPESLPGLASGGFRGKRSLCIGD